MQQTETELSRFEERQATRNAALWFVFLLAATGLSLVFGHSLEFFVIGYIVCRALEKTILRP